MAIMSTSSGSRTTDFGEGATVIVAGPKVGTVFGEGRHGKDGLPAEVTHSVEEVSCQDLDVLYLPGGIFSPLSLRAHEPTLALVQTAMEQAKIVAAICHAQWILVSAGAVAGRRLTCPRDMADDVRNAGGIYVDAKCVRDGNLITAVYYGYLPEQFRELMPAIVGRFAQLTSAAGQELAPTSSERTTTRK